MKLKLTAVLTLVVLTCVFLSIELINENVSAPTNTVLHSMEMDADHNDFRPEDPVDSKAPHTLELIKEIVKPNGRVEIRRQMVNGIPVMGGTIVRRYDDSGKLRWEDDQRRDLSDIGTRVLSPEDAIRVANERTQALQINPIIYGVGTRKNRHAYELLFAPTADKRKQLKVIVDAEVGRVLSRRNLVHTGKARVFAISPRATPELVEVDVDTNGPSLRNDQFVSGNCIDNSVCMDVFPSACKIGCTRTNPNEFNPSEIEAVLEVVNEATVTELDDEVGLDSRAARNLVEARPFDDIESVDDIAFVAETAFGKLLTYAYENGIVANTAIHFCDMSPLALADDNGDYLHISPVEEPVLDDAFVELQVFHHLNLVDAAVRDMGFAGLPSREVQVITNYRGANEFDEGSFVCDDGQFTGTGELEFVENAWFAPSQLAGAPALVFGQGEVIDWGLDAEIVYHEYGHAVMFAIAPEVGEGVFDEFGFNRTQAGLHEAYADLVAMWLTDNPTYAEYVGIAFDTPSLRDWSEPATCPESMTGEEHDDGLVLPSAIWHTREILDDAAKADFDRATFTVWETLGANDGISSTIEKLKAEFAIAQPGQSAAANAVLDSFITDDCEARVVDALVERTLVIQGSDWYELEPFGVPQTLQFRIVLETEASVISFFTAFADPNDPSFEPDLTLFLKKGDEPIRWIDTDEGAYEPDADSATAIEFETDGSGTGTFTADFEPGVYHLAIANIGGSAFLVDASFDTDGEVGEGKGDGISTPSPDGETDSGCTTTTHVPNLFVLLFFAAGIPLFRRRKRTPNP